MQDEMNTEAAQTLRDLADQVERGNILALEIKWSGGASMSIAITPRGYAPFIQCDVGFKENA